MQTLRHAFVWLAVVLSLAACTRAPSLAPVPPDGVILAFGDSLTYGTGAERNEAYPARLVALTGRPVVNAGVPGETTAQGLVRLPGVLAEHRPRLVLLCLGGNDMLRRLPEAESEANLRLMMQTIRASGAEMVLIGVPEPSLFSSPPAYYAKLAAEFGVPYEGEVMNAVLKDNALKSDPIHPNAAGYDAIANKLATLLKDAGAL